MACSDLADQYEDEPDVFKMVYRALSLRVGRTLSPNMLKAVDASRKPLENIFRTMFRQKRTEEVEKKMQVKEALTARPDAKEDKRGRGSLFYSRRMKNQ